MTDLEKEIQRLKTKEGNCRNLAIEAEAVAKDNRTREMVYRECWQAIEDAIKEQK